MTGYEHAGTDELHARIEQLEAELAEAHERQAAVEGDLSDLQALIVESAHKVLDIVGPEDEDNPVVQRLRKTMGGT